MEARQARREQRRGPVARAARSRWAGGSSACSVLHDGGHQQHQHHGEQGPPGQARLPTTPPSRSRAGALLGRVEGDGDDDDGHEVPQVDGQIADAFRLRTWRHRPGLAEQPGDGLLGRDDQPGTGRRRRRAARSTAGWCCPSRPCRPGTPGTSPARPAGPRRRRPAPNGATGSRAPGTSAAERESATGTSSPTPAGSWRTRSRAGAASTKVPADLLRRGQSALTMKCAGRIRIRLTASCKSQLAVHPVRPRPGRLRSGSGHRGGR